MSYKDWRDNCNPDLLYRLWKHKGRKEPFVRYKFGQKFITYPTPMGDFTMIEHKALTSKGALFIPPEVASPKELEEMRRFLLQVEDE